MSAGLGSGNLPDAAGPTRAAREAAQRQGAPAASASPAQRNRPRAGPTNKALATLLGGAADGPAMAVVQRYFTLESGEALSSGARGRLAEALTSLLAETRHPGADEQALASLEAASLSSTPVALSEWLRRQGFPVDAEALVRRAESGGVQSDDGRKRAAKRKREEPKRGRGRAPQNPLPAKAARLSKRTKRKYAPRYLALNVTDPCTEQATASGTSTRGLHRPPSSTKKQGDHGEAYVAIIGAIDGSVRGKSLVDAARALEAYLNAAKSTVSPRTMWWHRNCTAVLATLAKVTGQDAEDDEFALAQGIDDSAALMNLRPGTTTVNAVSTGGHGEANAIGGLRDAESRLKRARRWRVKGNAWDNVLGLIDLGSDPQLLRDPDKFRKKMADRARNAKAQAPTLFAVLGSAEATTWVPDADIEAAVTAKFSQVQASWRGGGQLPEFATLRQICIEELRKAVPAAAPTGASASGSGESMEEEEGDDEEKEEKEDKEGG